MEFEIIQLLLLGLAVGFLSSFFGIGGGSLIVPVLYGLYENISPAVVIPISLGSIFVIVCLNVYKFHKQKLLPAKNLILTFFISCSIGSFLGAQIVYLIDSRMAKFSMGIILILMVLKIFFLRKIKTENQNGYTPNQLAFAFTGLLGSFISSITGLGGGLIFTPFFMNILRVPSKNVSPYSNLAMLVTTLIGVAPHFFTKPVSEEFFNHPIINKAFIGNVNMAIMGLIVASAFLTSHLGVKLNSKVKETIKKYLLGCLLLIFALKLLIF